MKTTIVRESKVKLSARSVQVRSIFDVPPAESSRLEWEVDIPIEGRDWNVGLIVGPSGCGKSTIARELWPKHLIGNYAWKHGAPIIDSFPAEMGAKEIAMLLSSVGFSSPPAWLRPFDVLSNGEQFRVTMARALAETPDLAVIDEFTSVVDRQVAKVGSAAIAKAVRKRGSKMIAVTCHYDVEKWLDPDWVYLPAEQRFAWRKLRGRPAIDLTICRVHNSAWAAFAPHHYLTADLNKAAVCFGAFLDGQMVAFDAWLPFHGRLSFGQARRGHRTVCLPDFQGVGIGNALFEFDSAMWRGLGFRVFSGTGHPAEIVRRVKNPNWRMTRAPGRTARDNDASMNRTRATDRYTAAFEYTAAGMPPREAQAAFENWAVKV